MTSSPTNVASLNKVELLKQQKDGYDALQDLLRYSEASDYDAVPKDDFSLFRWFGVYQQRPNNGHFMLRVKIPGGQLLPRQLRAIARFTDDRARGFGDITTRQDIQLHWLTIGDIKPIFDELARVGMTTQFACGDTPRNIVSCPLAGVLKDEIIDTSGITRAVSDMFLAGGHEFSNLPRKFKGAIGGCRLHCHQPQINCWGLYGVERPGGEVGFGLLVGGGLSDTPHYAQPLRAFVRPDQVLDVARAIAILFRDYGYREKRGRARLKFLVADKGWQWTRDTLEQILGYQLEHDETLLHPPAVHSDHVGIGEQKDGRCYVGVPIERGRFTARNMRDIADLADRFATGDKRIRLTGKQNVIILDVPRSNVEELTKALTDAGLSPHAHRLRHTLISCTGSQFCNLAVVETKQRAGAILRYLEQHTALDVPIFISVTGCPNSCAQYQIADIGLTGIPVVDKTRTDEKGRPLKVDGFKVLLGGCLGTNPRFGEMIVKKVPADRVHLSIRNLIEHYLAERIDEDETFPMWCARSEPEYLQKLIEEPVNAEEAVALPV